MKKINKSVINNNFAIEDMNEDLSSFAMDQRIANKMKNIREQREQSIIKKHFSAKNIQKGKLQIPSSKCHDPKNDMTRGELKNGVEVDWRKLVAGKVADLMENYIGYKKTHHNGSKQDQESINLAREVYRMASLLERTQVMNALPSYEFQRLRALFNDYFPKHEIWKMIAIY